MKRHSIIYGLALLCSYVPNVFSQLTLDHNRFRVGDELIKQQVEFIDPGEAGKNMLWDFSSLKLVNDEYKVVYSSAPLLNDSIYVMGYDHFEKASGDIKAEDLIVGTEHNTMYYYRIEGNNVLLMGHENPVVKLQYNTPYQVLTYPFGYGKRQRSSYTTQGYYSGTELIQTRGTVETIGDAYGKIILPGNDTIGPVIRIKTTQTIEDQLAKNLEDNNEKQLETCKWYLKGYRYPVFETIRNIETKENITLFATAFYYPLLDHLYLDNDPENQKLLDEMWDFENKNNNKDNRNRDESITNLIANYSFYPNPVKDYLNLTYEISQNAQVKISIYSVVDGTIYYQSKQQYQQQGQHQTSIDCMRMPKGSYVLQIITNNHVSVNKPVIKK